MCAGKNGEEIYNRATLGTLWGDDGLLDTHGAALLTTLKGFLKVERLEGGQELLTPTRKRGRRKREQEEEDEGDDEPEEEGGEGWDGGQEGRSGRRGWRQRLTCPLGGTGGLKRRRPAEETPEAARREGKPYLSYMNHEFLSFNRSHLQ
jgi:hypothetical protein